MRKIVVTNLVSLDGYYEGADKNVHSIWKYLHPAYNKDISFHKVNADRLRSASTILMGRKTFTGFNEHWRGVLNDEKASEISQELAHLIVPMEEVVVSNTLKEEDLNPDDHTRIFTTQDLDAKIKDLKNQPGKDILVFGSRQLWQDLLDRGLVDELHLTIAPVIAGYGTPLFDRQPAIYLRRTNTEVHQNSGNITVSYDIDGL